MNSSQELKKRTPNIESATMGDLTWINIEHPTDADIAFLKENYPFHPLDLADCVSKMQRPKLDIYEDYLFLIFHYSLWDKVKRVSTAEQVSVFLGDKYVVTVHNGRFTPLGNLFRQCQSDEQVRRENFSNGSGYLLYRIIDRSVDSYSPILDKILNLVDDVEEIVFDENIEASKEVFILRRDVIAQRRIMVPNRASFTELEPKLARFTKINLTPYFGDVIDHMNKICETLDECKDIIDAFKDTDYILSTNRIKRFMRILVILGIIAVPFVIITGIYSALPAIDKNDVRIFVVLLVAVFLVSGSALYFFRRKKLI